MDIRKKNIIILITVLIILFIIVLIISAVLKKKQKQEAYNNEEAPELTINTEITKVENESEFFEVQECINTYFLAASKKDSNKIIDILNEKYISKNNISVNNVLNYGYEIADKYEGFIAEDMYSKELKIGETYQYYVYGKVISRNSSIKNVYIIANLDFTNNAFSIIPSSQKEVRKKDYINIIENIKSVNTEDAKYGAGFEETEIKVNDNNKFYTESTEGSNVYNYYLKNFGLLAAYDTEYSYDLLNEEYREARFKNYEEYEEFINYKKNDLLNVFLSSYDMEEQDDYVQYYMSDTNRNYYIFRITGFMEYEVFLDFYTLDFEKFNNEYDKSNDKKKVEINIQKIDCAINNRDYRYIYSKLANSFKENKFNTYEEFVEYMSSIFDTKFTLKLKNYKIEGTTFVYDLEYTGVSMINKKTVNMQIIMKLKEDRDFVMSFSIK